jgi:virulence-associated protein VagC
MNNPDGSSAKTTRVFSDREGLAIYIPDEFAYPEGTELTILRTGDVITIYPTRNSDAMPTNARDASSAAEG